MNHLCNLRILQVILGILWSADVNDFQPHRKTSGRHPHLDPNLRRSGEPLQETCPVYVSACRDYSTIGDYDGLPFSSILRWLATKPVGIVSQLWIAAEQKNISPFIQNKWISAYTVVSESNKRRLCQLHCKTMQELTKNKAYKVTLLDWYKCRLGCRTTKLMYLG